MVVETLDGVEAVEEVREAGEVGNDEGEGGYDEKGGEVGGVVALLLPIEGSGMGGHSPVTDIPHFAMNALDSSCVLVVLKNHPCVCRQAHQYLL